MSLTIFDIELYRRANTKESKDEIGSVFYEILDKSDPSREDLEKVEFYLNEDSLFDGACIEAIEKYSEENYH